jgi:hypothetical protein
VWREGGQKKYSDYILRHARWSRRTMVISASAFVFVVALIAVVAFYFGSARNRIDSVAVLALR